MSFFAELQRRNVIRVALAYLVAAWLLIEASSLILDIYQAPIWVSQVIVALLAIGFPVALFFAWAFEITPEGIKREHEVDRSRSIKHETAKRLDLVTIAMVILAAALLIGDRLLFEREVSEPASDAKQMSRSPGSGDNAVPVVAVLPLQALSTEDEGIFLASGLHDDLLTRLARLEAFRVISRTSVMEYADTTKNMRQIGEDLGAGYILEGGLQAIGGRVRINAQLIEAETDEHLWAETFDRELTTANLFDVQAEIASAIASAMHSALSAEDIVAISEVPTQSLAAYEAYLRGVVVGTDLSAPSLRATIEAFERATQIDPNFADAWAGVSIAYSRMYWETGGERGGEVDPTLLERATAAFENAADLAPNRVQTLRAEAYLHYYGNRDYASALISLGKAESQAPNDAGITALRGFLLRRLGRFGDAADALDRALELDPLYIGYNRELILTLRIAGRCSEAVERATRTTDIHPDNTGILQAAAMARLICDDDPAAGLALMRQADPTTEWEYTKLIQYLVWVEEFEETLDVIATSLMEPELGPAIETHLRLTQAQLYGWLGDEDARQDALDAAAEVATDLMAGQADTFQALTALAMLSAHEGDPEATRGYLLSAERMLPEDALSRPELRLQIVMPYARAGLEDEAIAQLRMVVDEVGYGFVGPLDTMAYFRPLHDDPRFQSMMAELRAAR